MSIDAVGMAPPPQDKDRDDETDGLQGAHIRCLRHPDRLGERRDRRVKAADGSGRRPDPRRHPRGPCVSRIDDLAYLKDHYKLVVLSNIDNASFAHSEEKLGKPFHIAYTAEDVGSYKPSPRNFEYMLENLKRLGIEKHEILHTAESMFHDHAPANAFGLANCWIYRRHDRQGFGATMRPEEMPRYDTVFNSMAELVAAHRAERQG